MNGKKAIIVGSGIGGMALSVLLANEGIHTTVFEKNHLLGGRCTSYEKTLDGEQYIIDMWTHLFPTAEKAFNKIFTRIKSDHRTKFYHFNDQEPPQIWLGRSKKINIPTTFEQAIKLSNAFSKQKKTPQIVDNLKKPKSKLFKLQSDLMSLTNKKSKLIDDITFEEWLKNYDLNEFILNGLGSVCAFMFVNMAYDTSFKKGSAAGATIRALKNWFGNLTSGYPYGGSVAIVNKYKDALEEMKGEVRINQPVEKIIVDNNAVQGVEIDGKFHESDICVSNAGIKETVLKLVGAEHFPNDYVDRVKELEVSEGADSWGFYSIKIVIDEKLIKSPVVFPILWVDKTQEITTIKQFIEDYIYKDIIPPSAGMYVTVPSNMDPNLCPSDKQIVNLGCICPVKSDHLQEWYDFHIDALSAWIPNLRDHILFMDVHRTGKMLEDWTGRFKGDAVGISQSVGQVGENRPKPFTPIKGLYLVGADVGIQGIGTELSALSSFLTFKTIMSNKN